MLQNSYNFKNQTSEKNHVTCYKSYIGKLIRFIKRAHFFETFRCMVNTFIAAIICHNMTWGVTSFTKNTVPTKLNNVFNSTLGLNEANK